MFKYLADRQHISPLFIAIILFKTLAKIGRQLEEV